MPVLERLVRPKRNRVSFEVPKEYSAFTCRVIVIPVEENKPEYDFSDLAGKLHWNGDAVKEQRRLRDEW